MAAGVAHRPAGAGPAACTINGPPAQWTARAAPAAHTEPVVAAGLGKRYLNGVEALRDLHLRIERGELVGLLGQSGSGKTTLLRLLAGAIWPTAGTLRVFGEDVATQRGARLRARRRRVATVAQQHSLVPHLSALQNVLLGRAGAVPLWRALRAVLAPTREERDAAYGVLDSLGVGGLLDRPVETLSGGQQQRVAVARALLHGGELVVADEPVASVDQETAEVILTVLRRLVEHGGRTVVVSLHQPALARQFCTRLVTLAQGQLVLDRPNAAPTAGMP